MDEMQNNPTVHKKGKGNMQRKNLNPLVRNSLIAIVLLAGAIILLAIWLIFRPDNKTNKHDLFNIETISELTTLECRYHNVAVRDKAGNVLTVGKQYVWFEYDVIIDVGIDINEARIEEPNAEGVVKIYLPPAKILGAAEDKSTISKPVCDLGWLTELTADEERQIINEGIQKLKSDAKTQEVIYQAYKSAQDVLEQYVINMGKLIGEDYTVEWIKVPDEGQVVTDDTTGSTME